jgi:hypothetical protein
MERSISTVGLQGKLGAMTTATEPSRIASLATFLSVLLVIFGLVGEMSAGGMTFGALTAFGLTLLAAVVLSHGKP